ncbi:hypothetical protein TEA_024660 [Camellia sinensis var. sinensis]|uniref:Uncharacterized protein n=1 Tax=Camellia sinensis var. sinensis TaxID=542762 RepID=A0A4S4CY35_CAMSN|nr:hypothetical protein TEA_024660 [Camellia sinensis var. sinensis]
MLEEKHCGNTHTNPNQTLLAFKPRQVLLAEQKAKATTTMMKPCNSKTLTLNPDQKALLLHSVLQYLEHNSFSRALKRLLSEAQIEASLRTPQLIPGLKCSLHVDRENPGQISRAWPQGVDSI